MVSRYSLTQTAQFREVEDILPEGHQIGKASHLFTRIEDKVIEEQVQKLHNGGPSEKEVVQESKKVEKAAEKPVIQYDDFTKLEIVVATISAAEKVPKTDKLLKLTLDVNGAERTVVSGIAEHYDPTQIVGKQVSLLANLAPRKLRGVTSQGMILMAEDSEGRLTFVSPEDQMESGSVIR